MKKKKTLLQRSEETLTHVKCLRTKKCQETEGFKGTEHEGVDMCEDGCVWFKPTRKTDVYKTIASNMWSYQLNDGPFLVHIIKSGFEDTYFVIHESGEGGIDHGSIVTLTSQQILAYYNIQVPKWRNSHNRRTGIDASPSINL